jgi:Rieske Fe-S protein
MTELTRRAMIGGAAGVGVATVLSGCSKKSDTSSSGSTASAAPTTEPTAGATGGTGTTTALAKTSDIPVGGGKIIADQKIVITQPAAGEIKAFTAVCTHQGCTVGTVENGLIKCPCHGSMFKIADGSVAGGPAPAPLAAIPVTVTNGDITKA